MIATPVGEDSLFLSNDRGATWRAIHSRKFGHLEAGSGNEVFGIPWNAYAGGRIGTLYRLSADRTTSDSVRGDAVTALIEGEPGEWFAAGHATIVATTDKGETWSDRNDGFGAQRVEHLARGSDSTFFAVGSADIWQPEWIPDNYGLYRTDNDGESWTRLQSGVDNFLEASPHGIFAKRTSQGATPALLYSFGNGDRWGSLPIDTAFEDALNGVAVDANGRAAVAMHDQSGYALHVTTDRGQNWIRRSTGMFLGAPFFVRGGGGLLASHGMGLDKLQARLALSTDNGTTWQTTIDSFNTFDIIETFSGDIYALGGSYVNFNYVNQLHRSTDGGASFEMVSSFDTWSIGLALTPSGHLLISGAKLRRSTDRGATWRDLPAPELDMNSGKRHIVTASYMYVHGHNAGAGDRRLFRSTDDGLTWGRIDSPFPDMNPLSLVVTADEELLAGTFGAGILKGSGDVVSGHNTIDNVQRSPSLTVSPNPTDDECVVEFTLDSRAHVRVQLFDLHGARKAIAYDGVKEAGTHRTIISTADLAAGTYVVAVQSNLRTEARLLVVTR
ncbi:MAG: hypothetical protein H7X80_12220 [bacterium]|nr:hypothetical protein [Candidatus Kapabacteria bacterium]